MAKIVRFKTSQDNMVESLENLLEHGWYDAEGNPVFSGKCKRYESKRGYCLQVAIFERI